MTEQQLALPTLPNPTVPAIERTSMLSIIAEAAKNPLVDVDKMKELLSLQRELLKDSAIQAYNEDFQKLERELPRVKKNGTVEYENKKTGMMEAAFSFATWEDMDKVIRPLLRQYGFSLSFDNEDKPSGGFWVVGILSHVTGHSKTAKFPVTIDSSGGKNNLQGAGSSLSYGKRYCTEMLLNIVREGDDDDGERGGAEFIGTDQVKIINALLDSTRADILRFFQFMQISEVPNIQKKDYAKALNALGSKIVKEGSKQ